MSTKKVIAVAVVLAAISYIYITQYKDILQVTIVAPDDYVYGALIIVDADYEAGGSLSTVEHANRLLNVETTIDLKLAAKAPWSFNGMRIEFRHPKYKPVQISIEGNPHWYKQVVTLTPIKWTTDARDGWIKPSQATSVALLEHLRWIKNTYLSQPEKLMVMEAIQDNPRLLGVMAYGGAGKTGEWAQIRQDAIAEWEQIEVILDERVHDPCPDGYTPKRPAYPICGRRKTNVVFLPPKSQSAAVEGESAWKEGPQVLWARADLASVLGIDEKYVRFAGYWGREWSSEAIGCPEDGRSYDQVPVAGYIILFSAVDSYYYHGREGEEPFLCTSENRKNF